MLRQRTEKSAILKTFSHPLNWNLPILTGVTNDGESFFYPIYSWTHCYDVKNAFNRIGQYDFAKSEQPKEIERLSDNLLARFELPDGKAMIMKTYTNSEDFVEASYSRELINKINELVDAVNELRGGQE